MLLSNLPGQAGDKGVFAERLTGLAPVSLDTPGRGIYFSEATVGGPRSVQGQWRHPGVVSAPRAKGAAAEHSFEVRGGSSLGHQDPRPRSP